MAFFSKNLPPCFEMLSMMELAEPLLNQESSPYVVVALQECQRMNVLLTEVRRSLVELEKGNAFPPSLIHAPVLAHAPALVLSFELSTLPHYHLLLPLYRFTPSPTEMGTPSYLPLDQMAQ